MNLRRFLSELKRRHVYRAAVAYAAVVWLLVQIATQVAPFFGVPDWAVRAFIVLLLAGFPFAMVWSWIFEVTPEGIVRTAEIPPEERRAPSQFGRKLDFVIIAALLLAVGLLLYDRWRPSPVPAKSIAVLPFENMTAEPANDFFADGIQDDILTSLSQISDLKVISRTSTLPFRGKAGKNLRQIGETLGVATILEGSVRRDGSQVAVTVQLIDARTDRHIWANRYDRTMSNALTLQGELAREIADALHARLSPEEKARVSTRPTDNADAYVLYLRARHLERKPDVLLEDLSAAEQLFSQAVELDPQFAIAHAMLAITRAEIFHFHQPLARWRQKAREAAETALRLRPDLSEAHQALGLIHYWMDANFDAALRELATAAELAPNDANVGYFIAAIRRRQGKWEEALATFERMQELSPQDPNIARNILITNTAMRRWDAASKAASRWRALAPASLTAKIQSGYVDFWKDKDAGAIGRWLEEVQSENDPDGVITSCRWEAAMLERDWARAEEILAAYTPRGLDYRTGGLTPKSFLLGCTALARGDESQAQSYLQAAAAEYELAVRESPGVAERHANLGLCYALLGRREEAIQEGLRATELKPVTADAFDGMLMRCSLALIYARVGAADEAFALLHDLAVQPGAVDSVNHSITAADLALRWEWDALRQDPRFDGILAQTK